MSPFLPSRPGGRIRSLAVGLLLALAVLLAVPAAGVAGPPPSGGAALAATAGPAAPAPGRLPVTALGARAAAQVRAAGPTPRQVTRSTARLERVKASLDAAKTAP